MTSTLATPTPLPVGTLVHHQVIQREPGLEVAIVEVSRATAGRIEVREGDSIVAAWDRGDATALAIPVGGPYEVVSVDGAGETAIAADVLVGDVWLLAGQSNMSGYARLRDVEPPSPHVHVLDMARHWRLAEEPLHQLSVSPDPVHHGVTEEERAAFRDFDTAGLIGAGLGLSFGRHYHQATGVPIGLVATAHGGTSLAQWSPALADRGPESLYGSMLASVAAAGARLAGILWYQGESDTDPGTPLTFAADLDNLVAAVRRDLGNASMPFFHVQLGRFVVDGTAEHHARFSMIRELQRVFPATGMASAVDLDLDDIIHISTSSLRRLGVRLARLAAGAAETLQLTDVGVSADGMMVTVRVEGAAGGLVADGHVTGFSVRDPAGADRVAVVHAAVVDGGGAVLIELARPALPDDHLAYAYGLDPQVRLRDHADMSMPAFGPLPLHANAEGSAG